MDFKIEKKIRGSLGRAGKLTTPHGVIETPAFVTVGTKATVKALTPEQVKNLGAQVVLANTYHLYLQPGDELVRDAGGLGKFMGWQGPTMTDSGGFQVFSLGAAYNRKIGKISKNEELLLPESYGRDEDADALKARRAVIDPNGVTFRSHTDGAAHYFTPEKSIEIQHNLGADIIFAFDECTAPDESDHYQSEALDRTHRWAKRSLEHHSALEREKQKGADVFFAKVLGSPRSNSFDLGQTFEKTHHHLSEKAGTNPLFNGLASAGDPAGGPEDLENGLVPAFPQALFGIVQGGRVEKLRKESAAYIGALDFDGFGIGGSFEKQDMMDAVRWVNEILPEEKPRHLLGIGAVEDLFGAVENGCDLFDCVAATREGRGGTIYTSHGKINITNAAYRHDFGPLEVGCDCDTCSPRHGGVGFTKAYLAHLFRANEMLAATLASIHNLRFIIRLVDTMRARIHEGTFKEFKEEFLGNYRSG